MHVPLQLRPEELRRDHEPDLAVPRGQRPIGRIVLECAARVLVESDDEADLVRAGLQRLERGDERRAARRTAVLDVDERDACRAEIGDHGVGVAGVLAAAVRELDIVPRHTRVGERIARRVNAHRHPGHAFVATEGIDAGADDRNLDGTHLASSSRANAYDALPA